jgi:hypothetical protein
VFDKTAHILKEKHYSMASLYFSPKNGAYSKEIGAEIKILTAIFLFESSNICLGNDAENDVQVTWYCYKIMPVSNKMEKTDSLKKVQH